jgi:hypothetical protein
MRIPQTHTRHRAVKWQIGPGHLILILVIRCCFCCLLRHIAIPLPVFEYSFTRTSLLATGNCISNICQPVDMRRILAPMYQIKIEGL